MASKKDVQNDVDFSSDRISQQVRTVSISIIALVWVLAVVGKENPAALLPYKKVLLGAGGLCLLALVADYLQYLMGYFTSKSVLRSGEREGKTEFTYNYHAPTYRLRAF